MEEDEDAVRTYQTRVRGPQPNLSYFAFTATPKSRTLKLFGTWDPEAVNPRSPGERGMYVPFHVYSMRQAIEEGFILDVLANYLTYETKWRLRNAAIEQAESARLESANPEVDERKAKAKLVRFAELAPDVAEAEGEADRRGLPRRASPGDSAGGQRPWSCTTGRQHALEMYQAISGNGTIRCRTAGSGCWSRSPGL